MLSAFFSHSALHFDHGVEQACSAAARVPPRSPSPGAPLLRVLVLCLRYEASSHPEGGRRRIRLGSVLPSSSCTCSSLLSYTRGGRQPGRPEVFPGRGCVRLQVPFPVAQSFKADVLRVLRVLGRPDVSSRPRLCTSLRPRFPKSTVTAGTWTWTPSYVARLVVYGVVHGCRTFPGVKCLRG